MAGIGQKFRTRTVCITNLIGISVGFFCDFQSPPDEVDHPVNGQSVTVA